MASTSAPSQLQAHGITTSLALVQRLKVNAPPSSEAEAAKITLALAAWHDVSVPVADKESVLAEWVLGKLARAAKDAALLGEASAPSVAPNANDKKATPKGKAKAGDPSKDQQTARAVLLDARYWDLVRLCAERMPRSTLASHVAKVNVLSIAEAFLLAQSRDDLPAQPIGQPIDECLGIALAVLRQLLSASLARISQTHLDGLHGTIEALLRFFVTRLQGLTDGQAQDDEADELLVLLVRGWMRSIESPANRKRAAKYYLQHLLAPTVQLLDLVMEERGPQAMSSAHGTARRRILRSSLSLLLSESLLHAERLLQPPSGAVPRDVDAMDEDGQASGSASSSGAQRTSDELFSALADLARRSQADLARSRRATPFFASRFCQALNSHGGRLFDGAHKAAGWKAAVTGSANAAVAQRLRTSALRQAIEPAFKLLLDAAQGAKASEAELPLAPIRQLLGLVEKEKLYAPGALSLGDEWDAWEACFRRAKRVALDGLRITAKDSTDTEQRRTESYEILRLLWSLSQDVVRADLASIWSSMAQEAEMSSQNDARESRLDKALDALTVALLDAHSQAREVPELLEALFKGLALGAGEAKQGGGKSWLFAHARMRRLASTINAFTAPMQVEEVLDMVVARAKAELEAAAATRSEPAKKKPRTSKGAHVDEPRSNDTLSPTLTMAGHVVLALPLPLPVRSSANERFGQLARDVLLPFLAQQSVGGVGKAKDAQLGATLEVLEAIRSRCAEQKRDEDGDDEAAMEAGDEARSQLLSDMTQSIEHSLSALVRLAAEPEAQRLPVALSATLFSRAAAHEQTFEDLLAHPEKQKDDADFAGSVLVRRCEAANESGADGADELWRLVAWKWPALFERLASAKLLVSLCETLVDSLSAPSETPTGSSLRSSSRALTRNAAFFEMSRWKEALYTVVIQRTASASTTTPQPKSQPQRKGTLQSLNTFATVAALPVEYWAKPQLELLVKRATKTDTDVVELLQKSASEEAVIRRTIEVRDWLALAAEAGETLDDAGVQAEAASLKQLIERADKIRTSLPAALQQRWTEATLSLFNARLCRLFDSQPSSSGDATVQAVRGLTFGCLESPVEKVSLSLEKDAGVACASVLMERRTLSARQLRKKAAAEAGGDADVSEISGPATEPIEWVEGFSAEDVAGSTVEGEDLGSLLQLARVRLHLWKAPSTQARQDLSRKLVEGLTSSSFLAKALQLRTSSDLALVGVKLLELLSACRSHLDAQTSPSLHVCARQAVVFASFLAAIDASDDKSSSSSSTTTLERAFVQAMSGQPPADYERALHVVSLSLGGAQNGLGFSETSKADKISAMRTLSIMLCEGPEGTMAVAHDHFARLLTTMLGLLRDGRDEGELVLAALRCLESVCSSKAMLLRLADVGSIFAILSGILSPRSASVVPPAPTGKATGGATNRAPEIFSTLVSLLASLLRLRQDLVSPLLPQLTALLMQSLGLLSSLRPDQGRRRVSAVLSKSPAWLDVQSEPLGPRQARDLARLMTSFTARSTSLPQLWGNKHGKATKRSHATAFEGEDVTSRAAATKTASLSKPFAKHAPYVLRAYVRLLVAPFTWLPSPVRKELQPGLMALCEMTGELDRDSVMVSLMDGSEKTLMKELWSVWERQRYRGQ